MRYDVPLSNFAFNFNLRRYNKAHTHKEHTPREPSQTAQTFSDQVQTVGQCKLTVSKPVVKAQMASALKATI